MFSFHSQESTMTYQVQEIPLATRKIDYSIVIPCYRSGLWLPELVKQISNAMESISESFEIILVNDRSPDGGVTWNAIYELASRYNNVVGIDQLYNTGQYRATLCGLSQVRGQFIITLDDDFQHPPEEIRKLIDAMRENREYDCILGDFVSQKKHSMFRNFCSHCFNRFVNWTNGLPPETPSSAFRIMKRSLVDALVLYEGNNLMLGAMIMQLTKKIGRVPVNHNKRLQGESGYSFAQLVRITLDTALFSSTLPLRAFSAVGFACALFSVLAIGYYLTRWCFGGVSVPGYTSQILVITFFGGMTLAGIGILGEYIARIIAEVTGFPKYKIQTLVGRKTNNKNDSEA